LLHTRGDIFADEVERNAHPDFLVLNNALEVHVHNDRPGWMTLDILENRSLALFPNLDVEDTRVERLVLELLNYSVVIKNQCAGRTPCTVDDCGYFSLMTQAAARTLPAFENTQIATNLRKGAHINRWIVVIIGVEPIYSAL
jgi:hypothetical protein